MSTDTTVSLLRQRMIEDMRARKLGPHSQRSHIRSCRRFQSAPSMLHVALRGLSE